jgi:hypothetical protein
MFVSQAGFRKRQIKLQVGYSPWGGDRQDLNVLGVPIIRSRLRETLKKPDKEKSRNETDYA